MTRPGRRGSWLLLVVVAGACGRVGTGSAELPPARLSRAPDASSDGRVCRYVTPPDELPPFSALARPGTRGALAMLAREMAPSDSTELSARYGDDGRLAWVRVIRSSLPAERAAPLESLLLESLNERGPPDWGIRLQVAGGDLVGIEPSVSCPPEARQGLTPTVSPPVVAVSDRRALERVRGRRIPAVISLDERGRIVGIRLITPSDDRAVDRFVMEYVMQLRFEPKLHDGVPVPATVRESIRIHPDW